MKKIMLTALIAVISSTAHANSGDRVNDNGLIYEENNDGVMVLVPDESYKERVRVDIPGSINFMPVMIGTMRSKTAPNSAKSSSTKVWK